MNHCLAKSLVLKVAIAFVPALWLELVRFVRGTEFFLSHLFERCLFLTLVVVLASITRPYLADRKRWLWHWGAIALYGIGVGLWILYTVRRDTLVAWLALVVLYVFLIGLAQILAYGYNIRIRWVVYGLVALVAGMIPAAVTQIEANFSDEEFFVALQALVLSIFWLLLWLVFRLINKADPRPRKGLSLDRRWCAIVTFLGLSVGSLVTVLAYQRSFYPSQAPAYTGVSTQNPLLCGQVVPDSQIFDGTDVFYRLLARVEANPFKRAPEYGMLALGTGETRWAQAFRESLLREAEQALFTNPANSVKSTQQEAALRAYYYPRVQRAFPYLFTPEEEKKIRQWFVAINRRALTVEWVDWLYALAFAKFPEGPYENQENGAGLLALLELEGLADPDLSPMNRDYLKRNPRGWAVRFRNTDDAFIYQIAWIQNAFFQSLFTGQSLQANARLAFEWLLLQSLPDGARLRYNHPGAASLAGIAYLGARLLGDTRYIWLSGRAVENLEAKKGYLFAQPGVEQPINLVGRTPTEGACLFYGDSGLPNQVGPLAPDKIVFRSGWAENSTYLLLNLRFTGWHRYKATNTLTLLYKKIPLVVEELDSRSFSWLPVGRSLFRDKRIPRENLNGLVVEQTGMGAVLSVLTGAASLWAEDPPYYARVERFETNIEMAVSTSVLEDWNGWRHRRTVHFYYAGPIVILDEVQGRANDRAALVWHVHKDLEQDGRHFRLGDDETPVEMILLPIGSGEVQVDKAGQRVLCNITNGRLRLVTLFLPGEWVSARTRIEESGQHSVQIVLEEKSIIVPLSFAPSRE